MDDFERLLEIEAACRRLAAMADATTTAENDNATDYVHNEHETDTTSK